MIESARFEIVLGVTSLILALWAVSYNLMLGYAGMVSFAHAAYYGVGAYTVAILLQRYQISYFAALAAAPLVAATVGIITGFVALRAVRLYFSLLTLAISQLLYSVAEGWYSVTGGDNGINGIVTPDQLTDYPTLYYFVAAIVGVSLLLMFVLTRSPFGAALLAIRENRERARSVGINVKAYELAVYTIAALFAGVAGALFPLVQPSVVPSMLFWTENATPVVVTLLGGVGSFRGPEPEIRRSPRGGFGEPRDSRGRQARDHRPERGRQVHPFQPHHRPHAPERGACLVRWPRHHRPAGSRRRESGHRKGLPDHHDLSEVDCPAEPAVRDACPSRTHGPTLRPG